jgi:putative intracellular protease/amidase
MCNEQAAPDRTDTSPVPWQIAQKRHPVCLRQDGNKFQSHLVLQILSAPCAHFVDTGGDVSLKDPNTVNARKKKRVAIVISNPAVSTTTGWPAGFWWSELTHPYYAFTEKGYEVEVFSPNGGKCEPDGMSDPRDASGYSSADLVSMGFIHTPKLVALVENTKAATEIDTGRFDAILVAGGQGPMFTYEKAVWLQKKFVEFYEAGKVSCVLCHGVSLLAFAKLSNGEYLAKGKTVTGFANVEEDFADHAVWSMNLLSRDKHVTPWRIEDRMKQIGANYLQAGLWRGFAIRDGNLVTGQQNFSGTETAMKVIEALGE